MRLIDADAIYQWYTNAFDFNPNEIRFSMNDIRDNLYNIPTVDVVPREQYESMEATCYILQQALSKASFKGWIPCSERLPETDGYYLTTTMYKEVYCDYWSGVNFDRTEMVVAWMELPQAYRGDE